MPGRHVVDAHLDERVVLEGVDPEEVVVARRRGATGAVGEGDGQREATVVVGVLPDEIDPAGRGPHAVGGVAEAGSEGLREARHAASLGGGT